MLRFLCVAIALMLGGCSSLESVRAELRNKYVGKPLRAAVASLGYPASELRMGPTRVLSWVERDSYGVTCELRLEVSPEEVVVGESLHGSNGDACRDALIVKKG